jgi:hypothetical protein
MTASGDSFSPLELSQVQRWFQSVVTHGEGIEAGAASMEAQRLIALKPGELERVITRSRALTAADRLAIYADAYYSRLLECLGEVFPMLKRTLGEDVFNGMAFGYLQQYPSRNYSLNELGRHFPPYLEQTRPAADDPDESPVLERDWPAFLIDLAKLEWGIYEVFDGPGVEGVALLRADEVLAIPPERWSGARLIPVVCLQVLATRFPVNDYYTALRRAKPDQVVEIPAAQESFVALTRRDFVVRRYNLTQPQFELLKALKEGRAVGKALEMTLSAALMDESTLLSELNCWFRNWTAEGFFQSVGVDR